MKLLWLDHVQLAMPPGGEDQARAFYRDLLGLREVPKPPALAVRGGCWFEGPSLAIHLGAEDPFVPARKAHPAFIVEDIQHAAQTLQTAHVPLTWDHAIPGVRRFHAPDPFGNRLEFIQRGEGCLKIEPGTSDVA